MTLPPKTQGPIWVYPEERSELHQKIVKESGIHPVIVQILLSRGISSLDEIHEFLYAMLPNLLDPDLFQDMDKAVERVLKALENGEAILVYGDNDVDGMTAASLLTDFFREIGVKVVVDIPNRAALKKSLIGNALEVAVENNCKLMITVDCGITAAKEIEEVVNHGIDVIITDHHEPTSKIPLCVATLNPKLINSTYTCY
jgi:single-stranded-DNA-specific exonuclease